MALGPTRRDFLSAGLAAGSLPLLPRWAAAAGVQTGEPVDFSLAILKDMAATLAQQPYVAAPVEDEALLESIDYDLHNQISYRKDAMLWGDVPGAAKVRWVRSTRSQVRTRAMVCATSWP